jgi:two-component SAPR family response regulator
MHGNWFIMRRCGFKIFVVTAVLFVVALQSAFAESYGLSFYSHEVVQDKRTSLQLNTGNTLQSKDNFSVAFDLSFIAHQEIYFGYIFRLINDNNQNIDLIYDNQPNTQHFKLIIGEHLTKIEFNLPDKLLFDQWTNFKIVADFKNDKISLIAGGHVYTEANAHLKPGSNYKLLFGANAYKQYQSTDLPPMKLRDVKLLQQDKLVDYWPLNEYSGNVANETVSQNNGVVTNPLWLRSRHRNWQLEKDLTVPGIVSSAFDAKTQSIYLITSDSVIVYSANGSKQAKGLAYNSGIEELVPGDQSLYFNNNLYYIFTDKKIVATYNLKGQTWDQRLKKLPSFTNYGHLNKFFSASDTSLYVIGGYGQLIYKDSVSRYNINTHQWDYIKTKGDAFTPRYLAGLGTTANADTAYILGGYGSASGQQIVNPRNLYDMMRFTTKDRTFKKLFELDSKGEDFVFGNSLIVDQKDKTYYGLIFPQHKYNSHLQLIRGSLENPSYQLVGDAIPYLFHDVSSFADLYYSRETGSFFAVTLLQDNNSTHIKIYSLAGPPEVLQVAEPIAAARGFKAWWLEAFVAILAAIGAVLYLRRGKPAQLIQYVAEEPVTSKPVVNRVAHQETEEIIANIEFPVVPNPIRNAIYLFGDLHLFTDQGVEITKAFTPLLKELFLIITLYSIKWGRGVSSEKLNEILWFDKSEKSARNNCSVNIVKLKSLLDKMGHYHLSKDTGYWKIDIDYDAIFVDYYNYLSIVSNKEELDKQKILQLTQITQRGNFLSNIEYEWLDTFKSDVSNEIIDCYLQFANSMKISDDPRFLIKLANDIFYFDPVNEDAMILKCKALSFLGKHSLAKTTYESFNKEYKEIYGEDFEKNFHAVME